MKSPKPRLSKKLFVEKIPCSRCPALAEREVTAEDVVNAQKQPTGAPDALRIVYLGQEIVKYAYLCANCQEIVARHIQHVGEVTKQSSLRSRRKKNA